jgi:hypothetical protein
MSLELTDEERERLDKVKGQRGHVVDEETCVEMRRRLRKTERGDRVATCREFSVSIEAVRYHAFGRCECDVDEETAEPLTEG